MRSISVYLEESRLSKVKDHLKKHWQKYAIASGAILPLYNIHILKDIKNSIENQKNGS